MAIFLKKMKIFGNFFGKNENFWQFFWKKCQVFGISLTFKWQFSGGSGQYLEIKLALPD